MAVRSCSIVRPTGIFNGAHGFVFDTGLEGTRAMGCVAFANAGTTTSTGYRVNVPAQDYMEFTACYANSCATAYDIVSGDCRISGGTVDHAAIAITVTSGSSIVSICGGFRAEQITNAVVNNAGGGGGIYIDPDCDFSRLNLGGGTAGVSTTMQPFVIPSASPAICRTTLTSSRLPAGHRSARSMTDGRRARSSCCSRAR